MHKKRALVLGSYLCLIALAACGPKVIDDSDMVTVDYSLLLADWTVVDQGIKDITIWQDSSLNWLESIIMWAKKDDEFQWKIDWSKLYKDEHDDNKVQTYANIIITEVLWVSDPKEWSEVYVDSIWNGVITDIITDEDWYLSYTVDFNDPKTYSELSYNIKVTNLEKN
jgi:FKBP-type peptidyl-prolyl cis-trans isomerase 2